MAKKSIIEREKKRDLLIRKYSNLRASLKRDIQVASSFDEKISLYKQLQKLPRDSSPSRHV
jgi:small subunit ribosomal protein S14